MNIETFRDFCLTLPHTTEDMPFGEDFLVFRIANRIFALMNLNRVPMSVSLLESLPEVLIKEMVQHSYEQVLAKIPKKEKEALGV